MSKQIISLIYNQQLRKFLITLIQISKLEYSVYAHELHRFFNRIRSSPLEKSYRVSPQNYVEKALVPTIEMRFQHYYSTRLRHLLTLAQVCPWNQNGGSNTKYDHRRINPIYNTFMSSNTHSKAYCSVLLLLCLVAVTSSSGLDCAKVANSLYNLNPTTCFCYPGFIWDGIQCIPNKGSVVFDCNGIQNTAGKNGETACYCIVSFIWTGTQCVPTGLVVPTSCSGISKQVGFTNPRYSCYCVDGYSWFNSRCFLNCSSVPYSTGQNNGALVCFCKVGYVWSGDVCSLNCSSIANSVGVATDPNTCACNFGYQWRNQLCSPKINTTNNNTCQPSCSFGYIYSGQSCARNCTAIPNSNEMYAAGFDACQCDAGYNWNGNGCVMVGSNVDCLAIPNSLGVNPTNIFSCQCAPGYIWSQSYCAFNAAGGYPNCNTLPNNIGATPGNPSSCQCIAKYTWNQGSCQLNCGNIANSTGNNGANACFCAVGSIWNCTNISCSTIAINCGLIPNAAGPSEPGTCYCNPGYTWSSSNCVIKCSNITNSNGTNANSTTCYCQPGYNWGNNTCQSKCNTISYTNGTASNGDCICWNYFAWNGTVCNLDCTKPANGNGTAKSTTECNCNSGYNWDSSTYTCLPKVASNGLALGLGLGLGITILIAVIAALVCCCTGAGIAACCGACGCCAPVAPPASTAKGTDIDVRDAAPVSIMQTPTILSVPSASIITPLMPQQVVQPMVIPNFMQMSPTMMAPMGPMTQRPLMMPTAAPPMRFVQGPMVNQLYGGIPMQGRSSRTIMGVSGQTGVPLTANRVSRNIY